jgi:poly-gamma-glutamate capsule biosynthesis protein CapA/YwtB (metallophosphatase superfamily)
VTIPAPRSGPLAPLYEGVRYENGRWPLWRWDKNLRYLAKSLLHRRTPWTREDRDHFARARAYVEAGAFRRPGSAPPRRIVAAGDLMWIRSGFRDALSPGLRARVEAADLGLVNLETPMVPERRVPRFVYETLHYNSPPEYLSAWLGPRPRVVSLCNNHALDQGRDGLTRSREVIRGMGLCPQGGDLAEDAVTGVRVGDLAVGVTAVTFGVNHLTGAPPAGVPVDRFGDEAHPPDWPRLEAQIDAARRAGPDLVVLLAHWGFEYEYFPGALQRAHARRLIELGVDVIVGSSPHVLQPVEVVSIDGADPACPAQARRGGPPRFGVIAWSLGNLATIMPTLPWSATPAGSRRCRICARCPR